MKKDKKKYQEIGQRIKKAREAKNLTQSQLGEKLSNPLTATAVSLYESGGREVSVGVLAEFAELLDVRLDYLVKGQVDSREEPSVQVALRADKELWSNQKGREQVLDFIEFVKKKSNNKNK